MPESLAHFTELEHGTKSILHGEVNLKKRHVEHDERHENPAEDSEQSRLLRCPNRVQGTRHQEPHERAEIAAEPERKIAPCVQIVQQRHAFRPRIAKITTLSQAPHEPDDVEWIKEMPQS